MHFHLPKPLHGWREFVGEVGIIVLGVLIALGAEQVIENFSWHQKVNRTEQELNSELHDDAVSAYAWLTVHQCLEGELGAAELAVGKARETGEIAPIRPYDPPLRLFTDDAWQNARSLEVADRMDPQIMRTYSRIYFFPTELKDDVVQLHRLAAKLQPLVGGLHRVSVDEAGSYQRTMSEARELQHRTELAERLLLKSGLDSGIRLSNSEMDHAVRQTRSVYGSCAGTPVLDIAADHA